jgi:hypothetical protein
MNVLRMLSRLPLSLWFRGVGIAVVAIAMLAFGLAIVAAAVVAVGIGVLVYKTRDWVAGMFRERRAVPVRVNARPGRVSDAEYVIIDHSRR